MQRTERSFEKNGCPTLVSKDMPWKTILKKEQRERFALEQKMGKAVKNCQKHGENNKFFSSESLVF